MAELVFGVLITAACVYGASAAAKLRGRRAYLAFRNGLGEASLIPQRLLPVSAGILAGCEAASSASLVTGAALTAAGLPGAAMLSALALGGSVLLTAALAAGVAVVIRRGIPARCACFGAASAGTLGASHLARNMSLLALLAAGLAADQAVHGRAGPAGIGVAAVGGIATALLLIRFDDLVTVFTPVPRSGRKR
jgi:methylamine utilization protein MauE